MIKSCIIKCKYENIIPSPEAVGKMFRYKISLFSQVRKYRFVGFAKFDVSELTQTCMMGIIEELFYDSWIISDLYIYVSRIWMHVSVKFWQ